jgi:calcineurin-like phosphoesterase family protein
VSKFFSADHHFGNENITGYVGRKLAGWEREFESAGEMDAAMVERWNEVVGHDDEVYYLGDFTLLGGKAALKYLDRLTGKIKFIPGGHDHRWLKDLGFKMNHWGPLPRPYHKHQVLPMLHWETFQDPDWVIANRAPVPSKIKVTMCHYPMFSWEKSHKGAWHLHGHSHGGLGKGNRFQMIQGVEIPSVLELHHSMDVGVDAGHDFYPVPLKTVFDILGKDG